MEIKINPQTLALVNNPAVRGFLKKIATKENFVKLSYGGGSAFLTATIKAEVEHNFASVLNEGLLGKLTYLTGKPEPRLVSYPATLLSLWLIHLLTPKTYKRTVYFGGILGIVLQELLVKYRIKDVSPNTEDAPLGTTAKSTYLDWRKECVRSGRCIFYNDTIEWVNWLRGTKGYSLSSEKQDVITSYKLNEIRSGKYAEQVGQVLDRITSTDVIKLVNEYDMTPPEEIKEKTSDDVTIQKAAQKNPKYWR